MNSSAPVLLTDRLPAGLTAQSVELASQTDPSGLGEFVSNLFCEVRPTEVVCTFPGAVAEAFVGYAYGFIEARIKVKVAETAKSGEVSAAAVAGGGAAGASNSKPIAVSGAPSSFGIADYELRPENADGSPDTQAGSHPFQLTTAIDLNQTSDPGKPPAALKDLHFNLPPGLIGNPTPFPQCSLAKFLTNVGGGENLCPADTAIGAASVTVFIAGERLSSLGMETQSVPLFALTPSVGEPARFGFDYLNVPVYLDTSIRTGGDYGVTVSVNNISELATFVSSRVTFWGVPGDPRHDPTRGWNCLKSESNASLAPCAATEQRTPPPLLTLPTECTGPVHTTLEADSWQEEGLFTAPFEYTFKDNLGQPIGMDGCNQVPFTPSIKVTPDGQAGSTPTGLTVDEHVPQETSLNPTGLAESDVKGLSVTLPAGVALNPAAADGLQACSMESAGLESPEPTGCPEAAKVATAVVRHRCWRIRWKAPRTWRLRTRTLLDPWSLCTCMSKTLCRACARRRPAKCSRTRPLAS